MRFSSLGSLRLAFLLAAFTFAAPTLHAEDWPQWLGAQRDGVWRETGIVETLPTNGFTYRWRTPGGGGAALHYTDITAITFRREAAQNSNDPP